MYCRSLAKPAVIAAIFWSWSGCGHAQTGQLAPEGRAQFDRLLAPPAKNEEKKLGVQTSSTKRQRLEVSASDTVEPQAGGTRGARFLKGISIDKSIASDSCLSPFTFEQVTEENAHKRPCKPGNTLDRFAMWNQIALDTTAIDHTSQPSMRKLTDGFESFQQLGPHRSSRAMAIVHITMFDAVNAILRRSSNDRGPEVQYYRSYSARLPNTPIDASIDVAIAFAAFETLAYLYPTQRTRLEDIRDEDLTELGIDLPPRANAPPTTLPPAMKPANPAVVLGIAAANAVRDSRLNDNSNHLEPTVGEQGFELDTTPGKWQPDPISNVRVALGGRWGKVKPFTFSDQTQFRPPPPPALNDPVYTRDFNEVKKLGGDGVYGKTDRRDAEEFIGVFWAYDGTAYLCAPPRLYNQIVRTLVFEDYALKPAIIDKSTADEMKRINESSDTTEQKAEKIKELNARSEEMKRRIPLEVARIFALVNTAMADAGISAWEAKWHYRFWRPITGIRAAATDNNPETTPEAGWRPFAAPASNSARGPNFTPPFPAYPSGHAVFGGAVFEMLRKFYVNDTSFIFISDEYNGVNKDAGSNVARPLLPQSFVSLSQPEFDNARSRIYLGVHWQFDADAGISQGNQVASYVYDNAFQCIKRDQSTFPCDARSGLAPEKLIEK